MKRILLILIILICNPFSSIAGLLDELYELDESGLESYYLNGEINEKQYRLLLDLYESGKIINSMKFSQSFALQAAFLGKMESSSKDSSNIMGLALNYKARRTYYVNNESAEPTESYRMGLTSINGWSAIMEIKGNMAGPRRIYRRSIKYTGENIVKRFCIGNYMTEFGLGLNVGRYDYYDPNAETIYEEADFYQVPSSMYNGCYLDIGYKNLRTMVIYSNKEYSKFKKIKTAFCGEYSFNNSIYGIVFSYDRIQTLIGKDKILAENGGGYFLTENEKISIGGEFSLSPDTGPASCASISRRSEKIVTRASVWSYSRGYFNPASSGISDNDEKTFYFSDSLIPFQSENRDRFGLFIDNSIILNGRLTITGSFMGSACGYESYPSYQAAIGGSLMNNCAPNLRLIIGGGKECYYSRASKVSFAQGYMRFRPSDDFSFKFEFNIRNRKLLDSENHLKNSGKATISLYYDPNPGVRFIMGGAAKRRVWIYSYRDYTEIFFGESLRIYNSGRLTFKYTARKGYGHSTAYIDFTGEF